MSSSKVRLASSIIAHSSPRTSMPWPARRAGSTRRGSLPSSSSPSALASRRAGSMVTTATRAPCGREAHGQRRRRRRLAHAARARADRRCACPRRRALTARAPARAPGAATARSRRRRRRTAASATGARAPAAQARSWRALGAGARVARGARRGPRGRRAPPRSARTSAAAKRSGSMPLADDEVDLERRRRRAARPRRASVSLTGISSGRATATTPVRAGSETIASIVRPWRAMRPTRAVCANVRGALSTATPWPVAGASRTTRS